MAALLLFACGDGCSDGDADEKAASGDASAPASNFVKGLEQHQSFLRSAHLADVRQDGALFIDMGTSSRFKYTTGDWKTGWLSESRSGDLTTNAVGRSGRLYFPVGQKGPVELVFRMRSLGARSTLLFLNNKELPAVELAAGKGFSTYRVKVPAGVELAGENYLLMRPLGDCMKRGGEERCLSLDWLRVFSGGNASKNTDELSLASLVTHAVVGGEKREAAALRAPGELSFYAQVPQSGKLAFGVGVEGAAEAGAKNGQASVKANKTQAQATVEVQSRDGSKTLFDDKIDSSWTDKVVDLSEFAGRVVRLRFAASGKTKGRVAWSHLGLWRKQAEPPKLKKATNVVVVLVDTLRSDKLKGMGYRSRVKTPVLSELAKAGVAFPNAQSPENWTKPSVASVLTSLFPLTHRTKTHEAKLPSTALTLSEHLKAQGFATGSFIANGYVSDKFGFDQGWDHYTNYIRESKSTEAGNVYKEAGDWIEKTVAGSKGEKPFFAYVHTIDPHVPYDPPDEYLKMYDAEEYTGQVQPRQTASLLEGAKANPPRVTFDARDKRRLLGLHDGEISYQDNEMGKFIERLKKLGVWDKTVFVFTSDHGEEFNDHGSWGHGHSVYQELLNVPLLVHYPAGLPKGQQNKAVVSTMDIAPTVLQVLGKKPLPDAEGHSLVPLMQSGARKYPEVAFSDFLYDRHVVRAGRWKLIVRGTTPTFFDLERDRAETKELSLTNYDIPVRYCRIMLGHFLGAKNKADWLSPEQKARKQLKSQDAEMDDTTKEQLKQLGYGT